MEPTRRPFPHTQEGECPITRCNVRRFLHPQTHPSPPSPVQRIIPVSPTDTPKQLAAKVLKEVSDGLREGRERGRERVRRRVKRGVGQSITGETRT